MTDPKTPVPSVPEPQTEQTFDALRLNALSDGLFAIVLTLLVLDIRLPETAGAAVSARDSLELIVPTLAGYFITFVIAGVYWLLHNRLIESLRCITPQILWINLMLLLSVGLLPFSTGALTGESSLGFPFYSVNIVLIGVTQAALWGYAAAAGLLKAEQQDSRHIRTVLLRTLITPLVFTAVLVTLPFAENVAQYLPFAIIPVNLLIREPHRPREQLPQPRWATFWRLVSFAPIIVFVTVLLWLYS